MKKLLVAISALLMTLTSTAKKVDSNPFQLRFNAPARMYVETLPLGNGHLGIMPDGGIQKETIVLNDISMWSGSEVNSINDNALKHLPEIQKLLLDGKNDEAQEMMYQYFACKPGTGTNFGQGKDASYGCFQQLGTLTLEFNDMPANVTDYQRELNLTNAVAYTQFRAGDNEIKREYFVSYNQDVAIVKLTVSKKKSLNFSVALSRDENIESAQQNASGRLEMKGALPDGLGGKGVRFKTVVQIIDPDRLTAKTNNNRIEVKEATTIYIFITSNTSLLDSNFEKNVPETLSKALQTKYDTHKANHIKEYKSKYDRVDFSLGTDPNANKTTPERIAAFYEGKDPQFGAVYFQYGRYLMICGSRENTMPLNLQGLWANEYQTPWNGDYHLNINLQMNYWQTEVTNLSEYHKPLIKFTKGLVPSGERTAKGFYGAKGWVAHMCTNPWNFTAPGEHASWGATNTGGAWLCQHLWEHYQFNPNIDYLKEIYPVLKGASEFFLSSMIKEKSNNWLVTAPSSSPENSFFLPGTKKVVSVCLGPTMDVQICTELFSNTIEAAEMLGLDATLVADLKAAKKQFPPMQISKKGGYLQEWLEDYEEAEPTHRHVSHLYGLHPSNQISPLTTPELAEACKQTLNRRGDGGTGWSRGWKVNFWARLHDGDRSLKLLQSLLQPAIKEVKNGDQIQYKEGGGTYPNLLCAHPPFQIDGNFGGTAGIAEMLVQSHDGFISFLPALPSVWKEGEVKGLKVRGGAVVDMKWSKGKLTSATIKATHNNDFKLNKEHLIKNKELSKWLKNGTVAQRTDNGFTLTLKAGQTLNLLF